MRSLTKEYTVGAGETDCFHFCRPSALLNFMQDTATQHAGLIGMSRDAMVGQFGAIWVLARCWVELFRPLREEDTLSVETWHRGLRGVTWYRDFALCANGEAIGRATNAWVMADAVTHRAKKPTGMQEIDERSAAPERSLGVTLQKLPCPDDLIPRITRTIRYSDLDVNCHLNNAKYADLICDALALESGAPCDFHTLQINYTGECMAGETILLSGDAARTFVAGHDANGGERFTARFALRTHEG